MRQRIRDEEILEAFWWCTRNKSSSECVHVKDLKERVLGNRSGSIAHYKDKYTFNNVIQRRIESRTKGRSGSKPPYYFIALGYDCYQMTQEGYDRLQSYCEQQRAQQQADEERRKKEEQQAFLSSRNTGQTKPEVVEFNGRRFVRDNSTSRKLKEIYGQSCQVCGGTVSTLDCIHYADGGYSEVHHIRPLGSGHEGPDYPGNMLVLCPDYHAAFDLSTMALHPDSLEIYYIDGRVLKGKLFRHEPEHQFDPDCLLYAWEKIFLHNLHQNGIDISEFTPE